MLHTIAEWGTPLYSIRNAIYSFFKISIMKSVCVCATLFACLAYMPSYSQVSITHYRIRYDTIKNR